MGFTKGTLLHYYPRIPRNNGYVAEISTSAPVHARTDPEASANDEIDHEVTAVIDIATGKRTSGKLFQEDIRKMLVLLETSTTGNDEDLPEPIAAPDAYVYVNSGPDLDDAQQDQGIAREKRRRKQWSAEEKLEVVNKARHLHSLTDAAIYILYVYAT